MPDALGTPAACRARATLNNSARWYLEGALLALAGGPACICVHLMHYRTYLMNYGT